MGLIVYLVRHARAGDREEWVGDDRLRPLDERGRRQAEALVDQLAGRELRLILSSPYIRCVESVAPLARRRVLEVEPEEALAEGAGTAAALDLFGRSDGPLVACVHGDLAVELLGAKLKKGATAVLELSGDGVEVRERLDPPA